jgi:hypothetical protein
MKDVTYVERSVATKAQQKQIAGTKKPAIVTTITGEICRFGYVVFKKLFMA